MDSFFHLTLRLSTDEGPALASVKQLFRIEESEELDHLFHVGNPLVQHFIQGSIIFPFG
jgi:hypothetical protein